MANGKFINIDFPFRDSPQGFFLNLNSDDQRAIKADLLHLLMTRKGQRLYNPDFGTDLLKYIFEPNDTLTLSDLKEEINATIKKYLPDLNIRTLEVTQSEEIEYAATISIEYTVTQGVFEFVDFVIINV
jgi:phage baseplate assembly protein W